MFDLTPKPKKNLEMGRCPDCGILFERNLNLLREIEVPAHRCGSEPTLTFDGRCPVCSMRWDGLAHTHRAYVPDHWCNPPPPPPTCMCPLRYRGYHEFTCGERR